MRVIIIEEDRFVEILELLDLKAKEIGDLSITPERLNCARNVWKSAVQEAQRTLRYHLVTWAQSHGAKCIR